MKSLFIVKNLIVLFSQRTNIKTIVISNHRMKAYGGADSDESDPEVEEIDVDKLPPLEIGPDEHKLQYTYCLWYHRGSYKIKNPSVSI